MAYITMTAYDVKPEVDVMNDYVHVRFGERVNGIAMSHEEAECLAHAMLKAVQDARKAQQGAA